MHHVIVCIRFALNLDFPLTKFSYSQFFICQAEVYCARYIDERVWDEEKQTFVAVLSGEPTDVDACLLLMAELGFVEAMDPKYIATVNVGTP